MGGRAETLRRRITVYQRCLREGAAGTLATVYRNEIAKAELELADLEKPKALSWRGRWRGNWLLWSGTQRSRAMYKIRLLRGGHVVETIDANTIDIAEIASKASALEPQHGADDWEIVNEMAQRVVTKSRWNSMRHWSGMSEPELSDEETRTLIDYARRKFAEERWPSPSLRRVRS
jgi:hypothetical protein